MVIETRLCQVVWSGRRLPGLAKAVEATGDQGVQLAHELWPQGPPLPSAEILPWVEEQHNHGLWVCLVREGDLAREVDLLCDLAIYGDRAVGELETDERSEQTDKIPAVEAPAISGWAPNMIFLVRYFCGRYVRRGSPGLRPQCHRFGSQQVHDHVPVETRDGRKLGHAWPPSPGRR